MEQSDPVTSGESPCVECRHAWVMSSYRVECQHNDTPYHHAEYNRDGQEKWNPCGPEGKLFESKEDKHD